MRMRNKLKVINLAKAYGVCPRKVTCMIKPEQKYKVADCFIKVNTSSVHKIIKATYVDTVINKETKEEEYVNDWLYNCESTHGDKRKFLRYYQKRIDAEFFQVPNDSGAVIAIYGS